MASSVIEYMSAPAWFERRHAPDGRHDGEAAPPALRRFQRLPCGKFDDAPGAARAARTQPLPPLEIDRK
jgi:hypothetical protein